MSAVAGVIRSTIEFGKVTDSATQAPSPASRSCATPVNTRRATSPLPCMLSQLMTVSGPVPRSRRRASASTTSPNAPVGAEPAAIASRSARMPGKSGSNSPVFWSIA